MSKRMMTVKDFSFGEPGPDALQVSLAAASIRQHLVFVAWPKAGTDVAGKISDKALGLHPVPRTVGAAARLIHILLSYIRV